MERRVYNFQQQCVNSWKYIPFAIDEKRKKFVFFKCKWAKYSVRSVVPFYFVRFRFEYSQFSFQVKGYP